MANVQINGRPFPSGTGDVRTMGELVELIKASIDPDTIITGIFLSGRELTDNDWRVPLAIHGESAIEITTGSREQYVSERLQSAALYLDRIIESFGKARTLFKSGESNPGNSALSSAVQDMRAFLDWYSTVVQMIQAPDEAAVAKFESSVSDLTDTCEQILQQQLYRSWWAIAETLEKKLEPQLGQLKSVCLGVVRAQGL